MYVRCLQCNLDLVTLREKNVMKLENVTEYVSWVFFYYYMAVMNMLIFFKS